MTKALARMARQGSPPFSFHLLASPPFSGVPRSRAANAGDAAAHLHRPFVQRRRPGRRGRWTALHGPLLHSGPTQAAPDETPFSLFSPTSTPSPLSHGGFCQVSRPPSKRSVQEWRRRGPQGRKARAARGSSQKNENEQHNSRLAPLLCLPSARPRRCAPWRCCACSLPATL